MWRELSGRLTLWARGLGRLTTWYRLDGGPEMAESRPSLAQSHAAIRSFFIDGPAGRLEALLDIGSPTATHAGLVCHPHPMFGGTMHNKVVFHAMKALHSVGFPVLRFNFRGTGLSAGQHDDGRGEVGDVRAALAWLKTRVRAASRLCRVLLRRRDRATRLLSRPSRPRPDIAGNSRCCRRPCLFLFVSPPMFKTQALRQRRPRRLRPA